MSRLSTPLRRWLETSVIALRFRMLPHRTMAQLSLTLLLQHCRWIENKGMIMKILPIVAAMIFGTAGLANAQSYDSGKQDPMSEQQRQESSQQGTSSSNTSGYGTTGSQQNASGSKSSSSQYGGSYQEGAKVELYDDDSANGTGPRIKGRY